ncbi:MAG: SH3-like domain-containing protein [Bacteroidales bacterium]|nr:SH3-like domain-containing protein [Bacteroidales bacterium]
MKFILISTIVSLFLFSCQGNSGNAKSEAGMDNQKVKVLDVVQTSAYTYLYVNNNTADYWIAVRSMEAREGEEYHIAGLLEMDNFYSKELERNFEKIWFVSEISKNPISLRNGGSEMGGPMSDQKDKAAKDTKIDINLPNHEGSVKIAELYANREKYGSKDVKLVGEVTRFNSGILSRNWIHIQDGSDHNGNFDLTATTADFVNVGDQVIVEGKLTLDKDFGSGYFYSLIIEEARVSKLLTN